MSIYDFNVKDTKGTMVSMKDYEGKVLLIVNTATGCKFTPQYEGMEELYKKYASKGFDVLDFPCNQFGHQAQGSDEELATFCQLKYDTSFQTFAKIDVNGDEASDLYRYLKKESKGALGEAIKWNFTKFLVDANGKVLKRYAPMTSPKDIEKDILNLLS